MPTPITTDLFDLAIALLTIRRRSDVSVSVPWLSAADDKWPDARIWLAILAEIEAEIVASGWESTTETADIGLVRRTAGYGRIVRDHPELMHQVRAVTTIRESDDVEVLNPLRVGTDPVHGIIAGDEPARAG